MATGPVSSTATQTAPAAQTAPTVQTPLRSGETITTTAAALKSATSKTYYHMANGARFIMPDGLEVVFLGGVFTTADPEIIRELDKIANRPTSMIYTQQAAVQQAAELANKTVGDDAAGTKTA